MNAFISPKTNAKTNKKQKIPSCQIIITRRIYCCDIWDVMEPLGCIYSALSQCMVFLEM